MNFWLKWLRIVFLGEGLFGLAYFIFLVLEEGRVPIFIFFQ